LGVFGHDKIAEDISGQRAVDELVDDEVGGAVGREVEVPEGVRLDGGYVAEVDGRPVEALGTGGDQIAAAD